MGDPLKPSVAQEVAVSFKSPCHQRTVESVIKSFDKEGIGSLAAGTAKCKFCGKPFATQAVSVMIQEPEAVQPPAPPAGS